MKVVYKCHVLFIVYFQLYRVFFNKLDAFTVLRFMGTGALLAAEHMQILPITFGMEGSSYLCSQITGIGNTVPLHVNIFRS
jgi:hypothetical protein